MIRADSDIGRPWSSPAQRGVHAGAYGDGPQLEGGVVPLSASHTSILSITQVGLLWDLYVELSRTERQQLEATTMFGGSCEIGARILPELQFIVRRNRTVCA